MTAAKKEGALARYFKGAGYVGRGLGFVNQHGRLWPWVLAPSLLTAAATIGGGWWAYQWAAGYVDAHSAGHWAFVGALLRLFLWVFVLAVGLVAYLAAGLIAAAPFAGPLSARVESLRTGKPAPKETFAETLADVGHVLVAVFVYLMVSGLIFLLQITVSPLAPFLGVFGFFVTARFLAYDSFDFALSRRGLSFSAKWAWLRAHNAETLGFGSMVALLAFVPGLGLLIPPLAAVGATLLYLDLETPVL